MRLLLLIPTLLLALSAHAQPPQQLGIALHAGVSHSGWNLALVGQYYIQDFDIYLGPSISLNRGLPAQGPWGLNAGVDYNIRSRKDWLTTFINLDYNFLFLNQQDRLQEAHLSYGIRFQSPSGFFIAQQLGYGLYLESAYIDELDKRKGFSGYNGLVRLRAGYAF